MGEPKKQKVDSECRNFQEKWTDLYFFVEYDSKPTCLICKESVAVFKEHNIKRHYEAKHINTYGDILGLSREDKIAKLRLEIGGLTRIFHKKRQENESAIRASYRVAHILSRAMKPFSDGECVKKCLQAVMEEMCPEKKNAVEAVSLSRMTITRRVEDMGVNLHSQLKDKAAQFEMFSIAADESTDITDTAQLLVFIRGTNSNFDITEELAAMRSMHGTTTGEDLFKEVSTIIKDLALPWNKLVGVTTDGARNMVGCHSGMAARVIKKVVESNGTEPLRLHCIIHQQNLCGKVLNLDHVMMIVFNTVNFIKSQALNHRTFKDFLTEIESEYEDVLFHSEVRWLSRGKVLKRFFDLRHEIEIFMIHKSKQVPQLNDPSWLWDLAILCDITSHLNELNTKLQGKDKLISHVYADICAFQTKLQLFIQQAEKMNLVHFPTCTTLQNDKQLNMSFPKERMIQLLRLLMNNFSERFVDFQNLKNEIRLFENPFAADVSSAPTDLQLELIDLQSQTSLLDKFQVMQTIDFYSMLPAEVFPNLRKQALRMITMFSSTYLYVNKHFQ